MILSKSIKFEYNTRPKTYLRNHRYFFKKKYLTGNISCLKNQGLNFKILSAISQRLNTKHLKISYNKLKHDLKLSFINQNKIKFLLYLFPTILLTKKPKDTRMGRGKGATFIHIAMLGKGFSFLDIRYCAIFYCI